MDAIIGLFVHASLLVYDMNSLLTSPRWLGTSSLTLELTTSTSGAMAVFCTRLRAVLKGFVSARIRVLSPCTVKLSSIDIRSAQVDASQLLPLAEHILYVEVEKAANWRVGAGSGSAAASAAAALSPSVVSPFDPASLTGPSDPRGASLCCTILTTRADFVSALSSEIAACMRAKLFLQKCLKAPTAGADDELASPLDESLAQEEEDRLEKEQALAEQAERETLAALPPSSLADPDPVPAPAGSKKSCPPLASRIRSHLQKIELSRERLLQLMQTELPNVASMHCCNVCGKILRVEGAAVSKGAAQPSVGARTAVSQEALEAMYRDLSLSSVAQAQAQAAVASSVAPAAASSSPVGPQLTPPQVRARLLDLTLKLKAASGGDAKARRKKIAKKISELKAKYAQVLLLGSAVDDAFLAEHNEQLGDGMPSSSMAAAAASTQDGTGLD
jgi:hypothetical protein